MSVWGPRTIVLVHELPGTRLTNKLFWLGIENTGALRNPSSKRPGLFPERVNIIICDASRET